MKDYSGQFIKNIAVLGHTGAGKTEVLESILFNTKVTDRFGKAVDGNSIIDYDSEEQKRGMSVYSHIVPVEWKDHKINFIDTPGYLDFAGEQCAAFEVADAALIVVNAKEGVQSGTMKAYRTAVAKGLPVAFFVTRVDEENANYTKCVEELERRCKAAPLILPVMNGAAIASVETTISPELKEEIAMSDDELTEKFLMEEEFTEEEIAKGFKKGLASGAVRPILCGSATKYVGIAELLDTIVKYFPSYTDKGTVTDANGTTVKTESGETFSAFVFKTVTDNFAQASYVKVMSGTLTMDTPVYNTRAEENEKVGSIVVIRGNKQEKVTKLEAGDIGALLKLNVTNTNDTLATKAKPISYKPIEFPQGMLSKAIWPKTKNDEDKMSTGLAKLQGEDKSMKVITNAETKEQVLYGIGDQHIDVIVNKLKNRYKVEVELTQPKVQYRETIVGESDVQGKYKKQNGGAGQYGDVTIKFEPKTEAECEEDKANGLDPDCMRFVDAVVGGVVPKNFIPAVEAGLLDCMNKGTIAGYKVVRVKATLHYGSYHPVDSKEAAFKSAARLAFKKGMPLAKPALLEPILRAEVTIPADYVGTIYGDFSKRRGMILENNAIDDETTVIIAEVPQSEMMNYATELRSMTQGNGSYTQEFIRYERAPQNVADKVAAEANIEDDDED